MLLSSETLKSSIIGLPGYKDEALYVPSLLVEFRKWLTAEVLEEINEMIIEYNSPDEICYVHNYYKPRVIRTLFEQQQYMYDNIVHSVPDRIVNISQLSSDRSSGER